MVRASSSISTALSSRYAPYIRTMMNSSAKKRIDKKGRIKNMNIFCVPVSPARGCLFEKSRTHLGDRYHRRKIMIMLTGMRSISKRVCILDIIQCLFKLYKYSTRQWQALAIEGRSVLRNRTGYHCKVLVALDAA